MPRLKIIILGDALDKQYAGVHIYLKHFLTALDEIAFKHDIYLIRPLPNNEFKHIIEVECKFINFPGSQLYRLLLQIPKLTRELQPDFVIEPSHFGPFNLSKNIKRVTVIHDLTPILFPKMHVWHSQMLQRLFLPSIIKKADLIVSNSKYTTSDISKHFPSTQNKITEVIPGSESFFKPQKSIDILNRYKIKGPYILFLGTIEPRKNLVLLVQAFEKLKKEGFPHQLVLVGKKGWRYEPILKTIENSLFTNDIHLPGYIDRNDLPIIYSMAEQFVYPSMYEGFGLPVLEAMCCGTPVITTNISSLPEVGGEAALYFENNDAHDLFQKMKLLATNPSLRKVISQKGLKQSKKFNWKTSVQNLLTKLEQLHKN